MFDTTLVKAAFERGVGFDGMVELARAEGRDGPWLERYGRLELDPEQERLVSSFTRTMRVLCMTGPWCGDCALQGAAMARIAASNPCVDLRFVNRNDHAEVQVKAPINAGFRVPVTFFMSEDFEAVSTFGDRTLSRYRSMARKALESPPVVAEPPADPVREVLREVLEEFERVHLLLRLSTRLRQAHGD